MLSEKEYQKEYREKNSVRIKLLIKKWKENHKGYHKNYNKKYYSINKEKYKIYRKEWSEKNKDKIVERSLKYYHDNIIQIKNKQRQLYRNKDKSDYQKKYQKEYQKKYRERNKEKANDYLKLKRRNNPVFRLNKNISGGIYRSLKNSKGGKHWENVVKYTLVDLKVHIEKQFKDGMTWDNYGKWHIDHKIPLSIFNITGVKSKGFKKAWSLENLQPLWEKENLEKGNRLFN